MRRLLSPTGLGVLVTTAVAVAAGQPAGATSSASATAHVTVLGSGTKTFTGTGRKALGEVRVGRAATLSWHHPRGGHFRITTGTARPFLLLSSTRLRGSITLRPGTYKNFQVRTTGRWRIQLRTGR